MQRPLAVSDSKPASPPRSAGFLPITARGGGNTQVPPGARVRRIKFDRSTIAVRRLTLVIGLASATTIFSVVYGVLWAPLPYGDADRVVTVWQTDYAHGIDRGPVSLANLADWRERARSFAAPAAAEPFGVRYSAPEGPERFPAWQVTDGFFTALRATPLLGRTFAPDEYQPGHDAVAVLDYDLWRTRFNADSTLIGRTLTLNDVDAVRALRD
jgi:hypothetical protein